MIQSFRNYAVPLIHYADDKATEWLYGEWSESKLHMYQALSVIPGVSNYFDYKLDKRADEEYLRRFGMTYKDVHDPRKLRQTVSGIRGLNFVSDNVKRLYK